MGILLVPLDLVSGLPRESSLTAQKAIPLRSGGGLLCIGRLVVGCGTIGHWFYGGGGKLSPFSCLALDLVANRPTPTPGPLEYLTNPSGLDLLGGIERIVGHPVVPVGILLFFKVPIGRQQ